MIEESALLRLRLSWPTGGIAASLALLLVQGCATVTQSDPIGADRTLHYDGLDRNYIVHLPDSYSEGQAYPLVLILHGGRGDGSGTARFTGMNEVADQADFVAVYPNAVDGVWNDGRRVEEYRSHREDIDDVGFIAAVIDQLGAEGLVDRGRVYVTGLSNGGFMATRLACELGHRVNAIAPVIASLAENVAETCDPGDAIPVLIMNGTEDPLVPWDGHEVRLGRRRLGRMLSTPELVQFWVEHNECGSDPAVSMEPNRAPLDGTRVRVHRYSGCRDAAEVVLYEVRGGGHTWPGASQYLPRFLVGRVSRDINASTVIWEFFSSH